MFEPKAAAGGGGLLMGQMRKAAAAVEVVGKWKTRSVFQGGSVPPSFPPPAARPDRALQCNRHVGPLLRLGS